MVADLADLMDRMKLWIWKARDDKSDSSSMLVGCPAGPFADCPGTGVEDLEAVRELLAEDAATV